MRTSAHQISQFQKYYYIYHNDRLITFLSLDQLRRKQRTMSENHRLRPGTFRKCFTSSSNSPLAFSNLSFICCCTLVILGSSVLSTSSFSSKSPMTSSRVMCKN